jgi:UDP-N-acetyl-D-glucosamine dehydrogenase
MKVIEDRLVSVIGQGYVGLPLSLAAAQAGYQVVGYDIDSARISLIQSGISPIDDISDSLLVSVSSLKNYSVSEHIKDCMESSIKIICVPTPLDDNGVPDLNPLIMATKNVGGIIKKSDLVIIESTIAPFTTRDLILPILEQESGLTIQNFDLAYSPERVDPANKLWNTINTPKIVSGINTQSLDRAVSFYSKFIGKVIESSSTEIAEMAKLLENSFRFINISFINELSHFCAKVGIDINEVIKVASSKPYGFMPFYPSIGAGGHCIPVDPIYLSQSASAAGIPLKFIELANGVNRDIPKHYMNKAEKILGTLKGKNLLIIGISYKSNISDVRESPAIKLINLLRVEGASVSWHDELVKNWNGESSSPLSSNFDLAILTTRHDHLDLANLGKVPVLSTQGFA